MTSGRMLQKAATACGNAALGALIGALLAAFGGVIGSSPLGVVATILLASALGGWAEGFAGAICGLICGAMMAAFGNVIGGSTIGVMSTIVVCVLLAGCLSWISGPDANDEIARESRLAKNPKAGVIDASATANYDRSHARLF